MSAIPFLAQLKKLQPDRWRVSINNAAKGPVTSHDLGVQDDLGWVSYGFMVDGTAHEIKGEISVTGEQQVILDGNKMDNGSIILSNRICGLSVRLVVELKFNRSGEPIRYRFDGRLT